MENCECQFCEACGDDALTSGVFAVIISPEELNDLFAPLKPKTSVGRFLEGRQYN